MAGERSFAKLGARRVDLETAATERLKDTEALLKARRYTTAIAMGLYSLEITLKVAICARLEIAQLPTAFETHDFQGLLILAGLKGRMDKPSAIRVRANWDFVTDISRFDVNNLRYSSILFSRKPSVEFIDRLRTEPDGVIPWISMQI